LRWDRYRSDREISQATISVSLNLTSAAIMHDPSSRRHRTRIPLHPRPYVTSFTTRAAISYATSLEYNHNNLEAPTYGMQNVVQSVDGSEQIIFSIIDSTYAFITLDSTGCSSIESAKFFAGAVQPEDVVEDDGDPGWADEEQATFVLPASDQVGHRRGGRPIGAGREERIHLSESEDKFTSSGHSVTSNDSGGGSEGGYLGGPEVGGEDDVAAAVIASRATKQSRPVHSASSHSESGVTEPDKNALERRPDFVIMHTLSRRMKRPHKGARGLHVERYLRNCGRVTHHRCILLLEEDKPNPSRRAFGANVYALAKRQLKHAESEIVEYLSAYFIDDLETQVVIVRSTSGQFWRWAVLTRDEIPEWDHARRNVRKDAINLEKLNSYIEKMENIPVYRLGTRPSDEELSRLQRTLYQHARACHRRHPWISHMF
ncbi:uncharacterized protein SCHCODRAFT_02498270, partial [Schizophyllum commune H4-8]